MKLPLVLYILLVFFNLLCLYFIIGVLTWNGIENSFLNREETESARFIAYLFYITMLLNLYGLFYIAIRKIFEDK